MKHEHGTGAGPRGRSRAAWAALLTAGLLAGAAAAPAQGVRAVIKTEKETREVYLMGRKGRDIVIRQPEHPAGVTTTLKMSDLAACEFFFTLDEFEVYKEERQRNYGKAAQMILSALSPTLPFLDLPENNAFERVVAAGLYLMRAGDAYREAGGEANLKNANAFYQSAQQVLSAAARATWHPVADIARARSALCLIYMGQLDEADKILAKGREPDIGDLSFGIHWLVRARLFYARQDTRAALFAAIRSVLYENKDIDSFPDALLLCAQCYEDLMEMHRTRDVYYEIARLFRGTPWGDKARARLKFMMDNKMTEEDEPTDIKNVFFGIDEDMNALANEFLEATKSGKDDLEEEAEEEVNLGGGASSPAPDTKPDDKDKKE